MQLQSKHLQSSSTHKPLNQAVLVDLCTFQDKIKIKTFLFLKKKKKFFAIKILFMYYLI